jgi:Flp pilus assembly protein TadB
MNQITNLFKFLLGILLLQVATAAQVYAALRTNDPKIWFVFALLSLALGFLAAFWFSSVARHAQKDAVADMKEDFLKQRERIKVRAEREKTKVIEQSHQRIIKDRRRTEGKASLKVGASFAALIGVGAVMLFTQFVTFGMLLMSTAGGALAGYTVRARQDYLNRRKDADLQLSPPVRTIAADSARRVIAALTGRPAVRDDKRN